MLLLITVLLITKEKLSPTRTDKILIKDERELEVSSGGTLLTTLSNEGIFLPSACGGGGTCVECDCIVLEGGGEAIATETPHFTRKELQQGYRMSCQVRVKQDMKIEIPEEIFGIKKWEATVVQKIGRASCRER